MQKLGLWITATCAVTLILAASPTAARADGCVLDAMGSYVRETEQRAFIEWKDGMERMFVATKTAEHAGPVLWIVPIPADPKRVDAEPVETFPSVAYGVSIAKTASWHLGDMREASVLLDAGWFALFMMGTKVQDSFAGVQSAMGEAPDVQVHLHVEKLGMVVEVITAQSTDALDRYLSEKKVQARAEGIAAIRPYLETACALVCGWSSDAAPGGAARAVQIDFPTDDVFYPLIPTSVYPTSVPTVIHVRGLFQPAGSVRIPGMRIDYEQCHIPKSSLSNSLFGDSGRFDAFERAQVDVTTVELSGNASRWTDDLVLKRGAPPAVTAARLVRDYPVPIFLVLHGGTAALLGSALAVLVVPAALRRPRDLLWACMTGFATLLSSLVAALVFSLWCAQLYRRANPQARRRRSVTLLHAMTAALLILTPASLVLIELVPSLRDFRVLSAAFALILVFGLLPATLIAAFIHVKRRALWLVAIVGAHALFVAELLTAAITWLKPYI